MPRLTREKNARPSGGERVFTDAMGRLWSATSLTGTDGLTVVFTCITEGRESGRAIHVAVPPPEEVGDVGDETLRAWLEAAPRIGRLT